MGIKGELEGCTHTIPRCHEFQDNYTTNSGYYHYKHMRLQLTTRVLILVTEIWLDQAGDTYIMYRFCIYMYNAHKIINRLL